MLHAERAKRRERGIAGDQEGAERKREEDGMRRTGGSESVLQERARGDSIDRGEGRNDRGVRERGKERGK